MHDWVRPGTHITAVGADAPGKQELESSLVAGADVLAADFAAQCLDHGEFAIPYLNGLIDPEKVVDLGDVLGGNMTGRTSDTDITIVDQTGIAAQDIAIADVVLSAYEAKNHSVN